MLVAVHAPSAVARRLSHFQHRRPHVEHDDHRAEQEHDDGASPRPKDRVEFSVISALSCSYRASVHHSKSAACALLEPDHGQQHQATDQESVIGVAHRSLRCSAHRIPTWWVGRPCDLHHRLLSIIMRCCDHRSKMMSEQRPPTNK